MSLELFTHTASKSFRPQEFPHAYLAYHASVLCPRCMELCFWTAKGLFVRFSGLDFVRFVQQKSRPRWAAVFWFCEQDLGVFCPSASDVVLLDGARGGPHRVFH